MPPTWSVDSSTTTGLPCLASRYPAVRPAGPPPSTTTGFSAVISLPRASADFFVGSGIRSGDLPVEDCAVGNAAGAAVAVRRPRHLDELLVRSDDGSPLRRAAPDVLGPRRLPVEGALGHRPDEQHLLSGVDLREQLREGPRRVRVLDP